MMIRPLLAALVVLGLAAPAAAQDREVLASSISIGGTQTSPTGSSVRLQDLGTSGGTAVLFTDGAGDVFARLLGKSDLPAATVFTDQANTFCAFLQTFGGGLSLRDGACSAGGGGLYFTDDTNTGLYRIGADALGVCTGGSLRLTVNATGTTAAGTLTSTGAFTASSTSTFTGLATFTGNVRATSSPFTLRNSGNSATIATFGDAGHVLTGTATVSGATTLQSTLAVTGNTTLTGDLAVNGNDLTSTGVLRITPTGNLTLDPTGDVVLAPSGNDILPNAGYTKNLGALSNKYLTLHAAELWVETLVAQDTIATIGGRVLVGPTTTLTADLSSGATSISVKHNQIASGDRVYLEANGKVEFLAVTSGASGSGPYTYTVTRNLDGSGANEWYAGDAVFNTGTTGDGFIDLYSYAGVLSGAGPTIVGNVRTGTTYNQVAPRWAIGNLNGLYGYGSDTYGAAFGDPSDVFLSADATNGIRILEGGSTVRAQWATDGSLTIGNPATNSGNVHIASNAINLRSGTTTRLQLAASNGEMNIYDPSGVPRVTIGSGYAVFGRVDTGQPNVYIDPSAGTAAFRMSTSTRLLLGASSIQMYDPSGVRRLFLGDLGGSNYGVVLGDSTNANQTFLQYASATGDMDFCRSGVGCYLNFDGPTGNITSAGSI